MKFYRMHVAENDGLRFDSKNLFDLTKTGVPFTWCDDLSPTIQQDGILYDWIGGWSWAPYVSAKAYSRLAKNYCDEKIDWHGPFEIKKSTYYLLNCVNVIDCALIGSNSNKLFLNREAIGSSHIFRPRLFTKNIIVTEFFKKHLDASKESGVRLGYINDDGWEDFPF
jgi:hypothetical protein